MPACLVTCFEPFGGDPVNPSKECVFSLPDRVGQLEIIRREIPTVFGKAGKAVLSAAEECGARMILLTGVAGGRGCVTPEVVAVNLRDASISDNEGNRPWDEKIVPNGPDAIFSTLPVHKMISHVPALPIHLSYSAGAFVCNDTFYTVLNAMKITGIPVGFVHVPLFPEEADKKGLPSLKKETSVECLTAWLKAADECCFPV